MPGRAWEFAQTGILNLWPEVVSVHVALTQVLHSMELQPTQHSDFLTALRLFRVAETLERRMA